MSRSNRRQVLRRLGATVTAAGTFGFAGCTGNGNGGGNGGGNGNGATAGGTGDTLEITIGCPTALSGAFAPNGEAERDGGQLAIRHLENDLDVSIDLVTADTEVDPSVAVERLEGMVVEDGVHAAYGGVSSSVGIAMGSWGSDNRVPFCPHGASDDITGAECSEYMFATYSGNTMQASVAAPQMAEQADDWYILYSDYTWGQTAETVFTEILEENGSSVIGSSAVPFPADDYTSYLNTADEADPDGIALLVAGLDQRTSMNQLLSVGLQDEYTLAMHQLEDVNLWGVSQEAAAAIDVASQGWLPSLDVPQEWISEIREMSEHEPYVRHYMGYTSVDQLVRAAVRAGSTDGEAIKNELEGHQVESERVQALQPSEEPLYWRAADHQLVQPVYASAGRSLADMESDPNRWFEVIDRMPGEEAAGEPSAECEL